MDLEDLEKRKRKRLDGAEVVFCFALLCVCVWDRGGEFDVVGWMARDGMSLR